MMSTRPWEGSIGSLVLVFVGVCCCTFPYVGLTIFSFFTGVGCFSLLDFAGTPHFLDSDVQLGGPLPRLSSSVCIVDCKHQGSSVVAS